MKARTTPETLNDFFNKSKTKLLTTTYVTALFIKDNRNRFFNVYETAIEYLKTGNENIFFKSLHDFSTKGLT